VLTDQHAIHLVVSPILTAYFGHGSRRRQSCFW